MEEKNKRLDELDQFWDIGELLPRRQSGSRTPPQPHSTETVELVLEPTSTAPDNTNHRLTLPHNERQRTDSIPLVQHTVAEEPRRQAEPIDTYCPDNPLLRQVRIYRWPSSYQYYARFVEDARRYLHVEAPPCPRVPFFSYVPQYTQLTEDRLAWYLYWRSQVRAGTYPDCDYTYLLLYLYEIINLGREIDPSDGLAAICALWLGYRGRYPRLDRFLGEWICDYCLVHHLPAPKNLPAEALDVLVSCSPLKEFWLSQAPGENEAYANALLRFSSNYDYHGSKFAAGENLPLYDEHIPAALAYTVAATADSRGSLLSGANLQDSRLSRDAFGGALCAHENKYRIEVDYCSFTRSHELRFLVTDIIKYSENKIRAHLGIKSRLGLYALPNEIRGIIDRYFAQHLPASRAMTPKRRAEAAEEKRYAALYEPLSADFSPAHAAEIEQTSWQTTQKLVEAFEDTEVPAPTPPPPVPAPAPVPPDQTEPPLAARLCTLKLDGVVRALLAEDAPGARAAATACGLMLDAAVDRINTEAQDSFGDILFKEESPGHFILIEDYREELADL